MVKGKVIHEIVRRLIEGAKPRKIILFGSYAYGEPDEDSDIDIIVVEDDVGSKWEESARLRGLLRDILVPMDIIVVSPEEFEFYKHEVGSVFREAYLKGVVLYDAEAVADIPEEG